MDGTELAIRFSYVTNVMRFCGPYDAHKQFIRYLKKKDNREEVEKSLKRFEALYPYLLLIAKKNSKEIFDYEVVEAYWIGNELLDVFTDCDMKELINMLVQRGLPKVIGKRLIKNLPSGIVPHHNFNVMHVGVGAITKSVKMTLKNMDNCRTTFGVINRVYKSWATVKIKPLKMKNEKLFLGEEELKKVRFLPVSQNVKQGQPVALHWGFIVCNLTKKQVKNLEFYTKKILNSVNHY